jgi:hypothetical protein
MAEPAHLRGTLTTPKIVLLVVAAAAPLACVVGTVPLAFALGDGAGLPAVFVFAGVVLLCFSAGRSRSRPDWSPWCRTTPRRSD